MLSFVFLSLFGGMIFGVQYLFVNYGKGQDGKAFLGSLSDAVQSTEQQTATVSNVQPVPVLEVNAKSAISIESNLQDINKVIFEKDSGLKLPIASLTKLMTAVVVLDNYNLSDTMAINRTADSQSPLKQDVKLGDVLSAESLLDIMLVESSNKSAYALSEFVGEQKFVDLMNQRAQAIGLKDTFFVDPTGISPEDVSTSADLAKLAEYILKNYSKISDISRLKEIYVPGFGTVSNTDELLGEISDVVCSKTGFTTAANGCLLLVINNPNNKNYLISVVLGADDRFSEMKNLVNWSSAICK